MNSLKKSIETKKLNLLNRVQRGMRKLSLGLVLCTLITFVAPNVGRAQIAQAGRKYRESEITADEKNIKEYRKSEISQTTPEKEFGNLLKFSIDITKDSLSRQVEGVKLLVNAPEANGNNNYTLPDGTAEINKRLFGILITFDKESAQRTYIPIDMLTAAYRFSAQHVKDLYPLTDEEVELFKTSGNIVERDFLDVGENFYKDYLSNKSENMINVKPDSKIKISRRSVNDFSGTVQFNEETSKRVADHNIKKAVIAWSDSYKVDYDKVKTFIPGTKNFSIVNRVVLGVAINPYPNENKDLEVIELEGETTVKSVSVKNQYIKTDAYIKNANDEDYTRLIGEVYHPNDDTIAEGAEAIIVNPLNIDDLKAKMGDDTLVVGQVVLKMPKGALQGEDSIFNDYKFKAVQNLRVKFFARPRTKEEFEAVNSEYRLNLAPESRYAGTGLGTKTLNHHGENVDIDLQGFARYDHYNFIGEMSINLDDTKNYAQTFDRLQNPGDTKYRNILTPGSSIKLSINSPSGVGVDPSKSYEDMKKAKADGLVSFAFVDDYIQEATKKGWTVEFSEDNPSEFTVTAPEDAKAGDTLYIPLEYTYTNGSTDNHNFYFVVKDRNNIKPSYSPESGLQGETITSTPVINLEGKDDMNQPKSYELGTDTFKDDKGNVWENVTIDPNTGVVSATVPSGDGVNIVGGEKLDIPIKVKYIDKDTNVEKVETVYVQFIARPKYVTNVVDRDELEVPFETIFEYDDTMLAGTIDVVQEGIVGKKETIF